MKQMFQLLVTVADSDMKDGATDRFSVDVQLQHVGCKDNAHHVAFVNNAPEDYAERIICPCGFQIAVDSDKRWNAVGELLFEPSSTTREVDEIILAR